MNDSQTTGMWARIDNEIAEELRIRGVKIKINYREIIAKWFIKLGVKILGTNITFEYKIYDRD